MNNIKGESLEAENILIVESNNDKIFIENLLIHINNPNLKVTKNFVCCGINDYECMEGLDENKVINAINYLKAKISRGFVKKMGILIDQDHESTQKRLDFINTALKKSFPDYTNPDLTDISAFQTYQFLHAGKTYEVEIACFFNGINQQGELETVLKAIKNKTSNYADCLDSWRECLKNKNIRFNQKKFDKLWISFYLRYDTCSKDDEKQSATKCNLEGGLKKEIWDFNNPALTDLKAFLQLFK
jgi:hypothetical protein